MRKRVLVVDDDRLVADTLSQIFETNGFQSEACYSAADGLKRARSFDPELLLCDFSMPGENGLELAEKFRREMPECKVLMLTAYANNAARVEMLVEPAQRPLKMLSKPCRPELLLQEAEALLKRA